MIVVALSDIHDDIRRLADATHDLAAADLVLLAGDLTRFGHAADAARVVEAVREVNPNVLAVPGNCDYPDVAAYLADEGINLDARREARGGVAFVGLGGSIPCPVHTPNEYSESQLARRLEEAAAGLEPEEAWVLLSHQPPRETAVDLAHGGRHVGSRSVRRFIEERRPLVCFTGHIHESRALDALGPTRIVNPGPFRAGGYAYAVLDEGGVETIEVRGVP
jgi:hypothetical protein